MEIKQILSIITNDRYGTCNNCEFALVPEKQLIDNNGVCDMCKDLQEELEKEQSK